MHYDSASVFFIIMRAASPKMYPATTTSLPGAFFMINLSVKKCRVNLGVPDEERIDHVIVSR